MAYRRGTVLLLLFTYTEGKSILNLNSLGADCDVHHMTVMFAMFKELGIVTRSS